MGRIRRKRRRATWFPVLGQEIAGSGSGLNPDGFDSHFTGELTHAFGAGNYQADVIPLTWDYPADVEVTVFDQVPSLADWQGSAWQLEGIKGGIRCAISGTSDGQGGTLEQFVRVACFAEVLRVNPEDGSPLDDLEDYSTFLAANRRDPYIWQRSWILQSQQVNLLPASQVFFVGPQRFPQGNWQYEGRDTGTCIDAKSKRYIGTDERLFMCVEAVQVSGVNLEIVAATENPQWQVSYDLDVRVLGRLRRSTNRKNASR